MYIKTSWILPIFRWIILLSLAFCIQFVQAESQTWTVDDDGPADFSTLQAAVDAASEGDTIFVYNGTYYEWNIDLIKDHLSLIGESKESTIIDGMLGGWIFTVSARNVVLREFSIQNSPIGTGGIGLIGAVETQITNNIIRNHDSGIYCYTAERNLIEDNWVSNNNEGIVLSVACIENEVRGNMIMDNTMFSGIDLSNGAHSNEIEGNTIIQNKYGILVTQLFSQGNSIIGNDLIGNEVGIYEWTGPVSGYHIFHNNFINNTQQVEFGESSTNTWDDGLSSGGNYWSDYTQRYPDAEELGNLGIWNTPYSIDVLNQDNFPLTEIIPEFSSFLLLPICMLVTLLVIVVSRRNY